VEVWQSRVLQLVHLKKTSFLAAASSSIVDELCISAVVAENTRNESDVNEERFQVRSVPNEGAILNRALCAQVFSAFKLPHYQFNAARKAFFVNPKPRALHAVAASKITMYRERLVLAQQWLARHPAYSHGEGSVPGQSGGIPLVPIESLRSFHGKSVVALGMLSCPEEGRFELEDLHSRIKLSFEAECLVPVGLLTETCVVVVEGVYDRDGDTGSGELKATLVGQPHVESRASSCSAMGLVDPFRVLDTPAEFARALALEQAATNAFFVIMSDVHLDQPSVMAGLRTILETWASLKLTPTAFVLMGPFLSHSFGAGEQDKDTLTAGLAKLGDLIAAFPSLRSATWVLVPSAQDPGSGAVLPRPSVSEALLWL
jgi:DNA polymerase epsilon subunit 2